MKKNRNRRFRRKIQNNEFELDGVQPSSRKMQYYKKLRQQERMVNKVFLLHSFVKFIAIIAMLWLCSRLMICKYWYVPQNTFDTYPNKHIKIIGNKITPNNKIITALKTRPIQHIPIYMINTSDYENEIEKLSPVKKAFVRRYWFPARFEVTIEEEIPVITISPSPHAPEIAALTRQGKVISKEYLPIDVKKYKTYRILTYDEFKNWTNDEIFHIMILAQRIEDYSGEKLLYLDIRNKKDVFAQLETIKIRIGELNSTLKERIERLSSVMPQIVDLKRQTDYVDLRWDNTTYLKKRAKNAPYTEPQLLNQPNVQNNDANEQKVKDNKEEKTNAKPVENKVTQKPEAKTEPQKTQEQSKPQIKNENKPKTPQAAKSAPKKPSEPQALPKIDIQIVEP